MPYIQGEPREQLTFTPMCLDDYIEADRICRVISAYVGRLDMAALGFKYAEPASTGRPPHNPASMLMLYLYGYLNRIRHPVDWRQRQSVILRLCGRWKK